MSFGFDRMLHSLNGLRERQPTRDKSNFSWCQWATGKQTSFAAFAVAHCCRCDSLAFCWCSASARYLRTIGGWLLGTGNRSEVIQLARERAGQRGQIDCWYFLLFQFIWRKYGPQRHAIQRENCLTPLNAICGTHIRRNCTDFWVNRRLACWNVAQIGSVRRSH